MVLFERDLRAQGASVRNFGLIFPVGAAPGHVHVRAVRSLAFWREIAKQAGLWHRQCGAQILARHADEAAIIEEFADTDRGREFACQLQTRAEAVAMNSALRADGLLGALWCPDVMVVDPRQVAIQLPRWLSREHDVVLRYGTAVRDVALPHVHAGAETWQVERAVVCPGTDLVSLYPAALGNMDLVRCKLQMMHTNPQPSQWRMGPVVASGLSLRHYAAFSSCKAQTALQERIARDSPALDRLRIHVMAVQHSAGELVVGDSHEYGPEPEPYDKCEIDRLIIEHLRTFLQPSSLTMAAHWSGTYVKASSDDVAIAIPAPDVRVVTGLGGTGMTSSLAVAVDVLEQW